MCILYKIELIKDFFSKISPICHFVFLVVMWGKFQITVISPSERIFMVIFQDIIAAEIITDPEILCREMFHSHHKSKLGDQRFAVTVPQKT